MILDLYNRILESDWSEGDEFFSDSSAGYNPNDFLFFFVVTAHSDKLVGWTLYIIEDL